MAVIRKAAAPGFADRHNGPAGDVHIAPDGVGIVALPVTVLLVQADPNRGCYLGQKVPNSVRKGGF